jgi:tryptophan 7-halogenase
MNIVILGGGAAGWLTALYADKYFNGHNITLIESEKIGILGAGEGTTPQIISSLRFLDIDPIDLIKKTGGTLKAGINFVNWNGDNKRYFHPFTSDDYTYLIHEALNKNKKIDDFLYENKISYKNLIDTKNCPYALHFDAHKLAAYLKNIAINRGVKHVVGEFKNVKTVNNKIKEICLTNSKKYKSDFVFDCSGFARLLIGKHYKTKWVCYKKHLPMKKAVPFMLKKDKELKPYTEAIAMKYGWVWKIPLQERWGAGYIFDSNYINADQAIKEASIYFKQDLKAIREFSFDAGRYEKVWIENCLAIGLSSGFTEPLEATSIWLALTQLESLKHFLSDVVTLNKSSIAKYNQTVAENNDNVLCFLYLHYLGKRKDSLFWKEFKNKTEMPEGLKSILNNIQDGSFNLVHLLSSKGDVYFSYVGHILVSNGLGLIKKNKEMLFYNTYPSIEEYIQKTKINIKKAVSHNVFLEIK